MAVWTTDYDCGHETMFWYVVKDTPFDISQLNSKRRYEITRGNRYFLVREIVPADFGEEICSVIAEARKGYSGASGSIDREKVISGVKNWKFYKVYGAFFRENEELAGYMTVTRQGQHIGLCIQQAKPEYEKYQVNAALINKLLEDHAEDLSQGAYINDGSRNIQHLTHFQDYLEKYFQFRKAYCRLHIIYHPRIKWLVKLLYPFRKLLRRLDSIKLIHKINGVLLMEEISRSS